jgi:hypothetical protein
MEPVVVEIGEGEKKKTITIKAEGAGKVILRDEKGAKLKPAQGRVGDLILMEVGGGSPKPVISVTDGTVIVTKGSTCSWYFSGGIWYRICV